uniref:Uncharacterized protein n=1 Tax=Amphora coffeiformis TaxID=265554 RepID=A0A7S3L676_9STRA
MADCMTEWLDLKSDLNDKSFCHRLFCWPCDSSVAFCVALRNCDCSGVMKVLCCCPCRTCCGGCPTDAESRSAKELDDEPEEIPYTRVFEMEKKKREKMKATVQ